MSSSKIDPPLYPNIEQELNCEELVANFEKINYNIENIPNRIERILDADSTLCLYLGDMAEVYTEYLRFFKNFVKGERIENISRYFKELKLPDILGSDQ